MTCAIKSVISEKQFFNYTIGLHYSIISFILLYTILKLFYTEKKVKPLKRVKALKQQKEIDELMLKPAVRIQKLKNSLIVLGHELFATKKIHYLNY